MGQLESLKRRLQKNYPIQTRYKATTDTDVKAGYVRKVEQFELNKARDKLQCYLPQLPVTNPHKPQKVRKVSISSKITRCSPQRQTPIWTRPVADSDQNYFCSREHQLSLLAVIKAIFVRVAVPSDANQCLQFLWREDPEQRIEVYEFLWQRARQLLQITLCIK